MFEYFTEAHELFVYRLGIARGASRRAIVTLGTLEQHAQRREVNALVRDLQEEARAHAAVLEDVFADLERNVAVPPGHAADGLDHEAHLVLRKTENAIMDVAVLPLALEILYGALAAYEPLAIYAREWLEEGVASRLETILVELLSSRNRVLEMTRKVFASSETVEAQKD
ncbi:DUF892 family protein [Sinomonas sp. ASV322]|uniref:DUF892 family protein n=1 Tax=Sinomonas sp. ASV322 TaxID=3041920 RepID=UPI0027DCC468|nr:DUF892 family protein [Sinomonas sp. ASV322]MDQ4503151.1 DUF892 family protein [Sinomonas sp. ASV322]